MEESVPQRRCLRFSPSVLRGRVGASVTTREISAAFNSLYAEMDGRGEAVRERQNVTVYEGVHSGPALRASRVLHSTFLTTTTAVIKRGNSFAWDFWVELKSSSLFWVVRIEYNNLWLA